MYEEKKQQRQQQKQENSLKFQSVYIQEIKIWRYLFSCSAYLTGLLHNYS